MQESACSGENGAIVSQCVWWRFAVLVYLREGPQALLQNTPSALCLMSLQRMLLCWYL